MSLRQTAFHSRTAALGATFVEYAGYDFPSQYAADITDEYWACRQTGRHHGPDAPPQGRGDRARAPRPCCRPP